MRALSKLRHTNVATVVGAIMRDSVRGQASPLHSLRLWICAETRIFE